MAIKYDITLSTTEPNNEVGIIKIRQADEQTQTLVVQITENSTPRSYDGLEVFFCAKLGQSAGLGIIEQKLNPAELTNPAEGKLEYTMRAEDWQQLGRQTGYFSFRKMTDDHTYTEQFSTRDFYFTVIKNVFSEGLTEVKKDGSTYVWTIEDLLRLFNQYIDSGKHDWEEFVDQNREIIESVDPGGIVLTELIAARKPEGSTEAYPDLPTRLDKQFGLDSDFRDFEHDQSFMKRVYSEFTERAINSKWHNILTRLELQALFDLAAAEKRNVLIEQRDYEVPIKLDGLEDVEIDFGSSLLKSTVAQNEPLILIENCKRVRIKRFTIDGNDKNPRAIVIRNCNTLEIDQFTIENLNLEIIGNIRVVGIEVQTDTCRDIKIHGFTLENCQSVNDEIIGNARGTTRGIHLLSDTFQSNKDAKIEFYDFTIKNLISEDADAIHLQNCGEIDAHFHDFYIENCFARGIKIQNSKKSRFDKFEIRSEDGFLFRQAAISDYAGGNTFTNYKIKVFAKFGVDIMPLMSEAEGSTHSDFLIEMLNESLVNGSHSYPMSITGSDYILKNLSVKDAILLTKNNYAIVCSSFTKNLEIRNIVGISTDVNKSMNGIALTAPFVSGIDGATHSHTNLIIDNVTADVQGVYMSGATTVSKGSSITNIKTKAGQSTNAMSGSQRVIVNPPDFYRGSNASPLTDYSIGDVIWNTNFTTRPDIAFWVCVSKSPDGVPSWRSVTFNQQ